MKFKYSFYRLEAANLHECRDAKRIGQRRAWIKVTRHQRDWNFKNVFLNCLWQVSNTRRPDLTYMFSFLRVYPAKESMDHSRKNRIKTRVFVVRTSSIFTQMDELDSSLFFFLFPLLLDQSLFLTIANRFYLLTGLRTFKNVFSQFRKNECNCEERCGRLLKSDRWDP